MKSVLSHQGKGRVNALANALDSVEMQNAVKEGNYSQRLSKRVASTLVKAGIDFPEQLLFMDLIEISKLPGIGLAAWREIDAYCSRFRREL